MNLESTIRYHFPKSTQITDSPRATASDSLTGTDNMAAIGMVQAIAPMGFCAFMGKVGVSQYDSIRAVSLLTDYALQTCDRVAALRKLDTDIKPVVMQTLANFAFADYCRSADSKKPCECCNGEGFIDVEVFTMKSAFGNERPAEFAGVTRVDSRLACNVAKERREIVRVICKTCKGKCTLSTACDDCKGRGQAMHRKMTEEAGEPVWCDCKRCGGRGFERIASTVVYRAVSQLTDSISLDTWKKSVKSFYDELAQKLEIEEGWANAALHKVTA